MNELTFKELRNANAKRQKVFGHNCETWSHTDWGCAVAGEVGELCNFLKKLRRGESIPLRCVADEMGDVVIYLDILAREMNLDLGECIRDKFNEVSRKRGFEVTL